MNPIIGIAVKDVKTFFREKGTVFWTIAFPVIVLLLFSAIFGREIPFNANIGIINEDDQTQITDSVISGLKEMKIFTLKNFTDKNEALKELNATNIRAVLIIPKNFTQNIFLGKANVSLVVDETNPDVARLIKDGIKTFFTEYYKHLNPNYTEPVIVDEKPVKGRVIGYKEYILPGVLCYPLLFSSMVASTGAI
ncbi:MAG: ABC transporter permease, partial [Candidatus Bathyarchaeia archaeon]